MIKTIKFYGNVSQYSVHKERVVTLVPMGNAPASKGPGKIIYLDLSFHTRNMRLRDTQCQVLGSHSHGGGQDPGLPTPSPVRFAL